MTDEDLSKLITYEQQRSRKWFVEITTVSAGGYFGELALESDKPRAATIICID